MITPMQSPCITLGGHISIGGGEGGKRMLAGDWHWTGACCARAGWVTGGDGVVVVVRNMQYKELST